MIHLIREHHQKDFCPYCKNDMKDSKWESLFHLDKVYKTAECNSCKRNISIKMDFFGSGHDDWKKDWDKVTVLKEKDRELIRLEDRIKVVQKEQK